MAQNRNVVQFNSLKIIIATVKRIDKHLIFTFIFYLQFYLLSIFLHIFEHLGHIVPTILKIYFNSV